MTYLRNGANSKLDLKSMGLVEVRADGLKRTVSLIRDERCLNDCKLSSSVSYPSKII